jgi:hypothetical protein
MARWYARDPTKRSVGSRRRDDPRLPHGTARTKSWRTE